MLTQSTVKKVLVSGVLGSGFSGNPVLQQIVVVDALAVNYSQL